MKTIVVYYSLTGNTARICQAVAAALGADLAPIRAPLFKGKAWTLFWGGFMSIMNFFPRIIGGPKDLSGYDLVVIGGQVWTGKLSLPLRAWLRQRPVLPAAAAFVLTSGEPDCPEQVFAECASLAGRVPLARLHVSQALCETGDPAQLAAPLISAINAACPSSFQKYSKRKTQVPSTVQTGPKPCV